MWILFLRLYLIGVLANFATSFIMFVALYRHIWKYKFFPGGLLFSSTLVHSLPYVMMLPYLLAFNHIGHGFYIRNFSRLPETIEGVTLAMLIERGALSTADLSDKDLNRILSTAALIVMNDGWLTVEVPDMSDMDISNDDNEDADSNDSDSNSNNN